MSKKFTDSRLREIALMSSKGLPVDLISTLTGLPAKSVANICWIYKWSPEKLDEMNERSKLRGPKGDDARSGLRRYFIMHPEQRPSPLLNLFREDQNKPEPVCQSEPPETMREAGRDFIDDIKRTVIEAGDAGRAPDLTSWALSRRVARLEDLANCFRDDLHQLKIARENHDERLTNNHKRLSAFQHFVDGLSHLPDAGDQLTSLAGRVDELERRVAVMHRDVAGLKQASGPEALPITLDRLTKCEKGLLYLQNVLQELADALNKVYE